MLPSQFRLKKRIEYKVLLKRSKRIKGSLVSIDFYIDPTSATKLGITAPTKFGSAVERNRFKRIAREAFKQAMPDLPKGCLLHLFPKRHVKSAKTAELLQEILQLVHASQS